MTSFSQNRPSRDPEPRPRRHRATILLVTSLSVGFALGAMPGCGNLGGSVGSFGQEVISIAEALMKCLVGRCQNKDPKAPKGGKMPPYNYGYGYICDRYRNNKFWECIYEDLKKCRALRDAENDPVKAKQIFDDCMKEPRAKCLKPADEARDFCKDKKNTCNVVKELCLGDRCTEDDDRDDCWKVENDGKRQCLGYTHYKGNGEFEFIKVICRTKVDGKWVWDKPEPGQVPEEDPETKKKSVPKKAWEDECEGQRKRCEAGLAAKEGAKVEPIEPAFCSAACYGHNCHHAAAQVCQCIKNEAGDAADVAVVVLDQGCDGCPPRPGDIYHSVIVINHPTEKDRRCLVESQTKCDKDNKVEEKCCWSTKEKPAEGDSYQDLYAKGCSILKLGPLGTEYKNSPYSKYSCEKFLEDRGTKPPEEPKTEQTRKDAEEQPCAVACGESGLAEVLGQQFMQCPEGWTCSAPENMVNCEVCEDTCGANDGTCAAGAPTSIYRGRCVPLEIPDAGPYPPVDLTITPPGLDLMSVPIEDAAVRVEDALPPALDESVVCEDAFTAPDQSMEPGEPGVADLIDHVAVPL